MERIGLVGINWKREGTASIAQFSERLNDDPRTLQRLASELGVTELVCLRTCNRVELAFVANHPEDFRAVRRDAFRMLRGRPPGEGEAQSSLRLWGGEGAVEHVFLVCAGLESARIGEREIVGQVRQALELARAAGTLGPRLETVFGEALKVARRVHGETSIGAGRASLAEIGLSKIRRHLSLRPGLVVVVGVGEMSRRSALDLRERGVPVLVVNRTERAAKALADSCGAQWASLDEFLVSPPPFSALISATSSNEPIFGMDELRRFSAAGPFVLVDLAVPADVDKAAAATLKLDLLDMDGILAASRATRERRLADYGEARVLVDESVLRVQQRFMERTLAPIFTAMQARYRETLVYGLSQFDGLQNSNIEVDNWTERMVHRLTHIPISALRGIAREGGEHAIRTFFHGADPKLEAVVERTLDEDIRFLSAMTNEEGA